MYKSFILLVIVSFFITGCSTVDVYTFKKDRVDQDLSGNTGFAKAGEKDITGEGRNTKRTLIGIDVELPSSGEGTSRKEKAGISQDPVAAAPGEQAAEEIVPRGVEAVQIGSETETEEEWIK